MLGLCKGGACLKYILWTLISIPPVDLSKLAARSSHSSTADPTYSTQPRDRPNEHFKWGDSPFMKPVNETSLFSTEGLLAGLAAHGFAGLTIEDLGKLNPPDEFETELIIMAEVRGYFQVVYKVQCSAFTSLSKPM